MNENNILITKLEELFNKLDMSQNERDTFYIAVMEYVGKQISEMADDILSDDDYEKIDQMEDEEEAHAYIAQRFTQEIGKTPDEMSEELTRNLLERAQIEGIKELLTHIHDLM